jgi:hypothetical protein
LDKNTGTPHGCDRDKNNKSKRMWTIRRGEKAKPVPPKWNSATHEWWSADGRYIYYIDLKNGTVRIDQSTGKSKLVNPYGRWHSHASKDNNYFVADNKADKQGYYRGCASNVLFYNRLTGKKVDIVTKAPALSTPKNPSVYHVDPHPQFVHHDRYVVYTTSVLGRIDVALVRVSDLIYATR